MVSIKDVARAAGVSDKTVSRVVNNENNVRPATVARVQEAIARLNYVPNLSARLIRTNRSRTFGIMTDYISTTPYSGEIVRGIHQWARENGRTILLANTDGDREQEQKAWRTFQEHRIDGVLYVTMYHRLADPVPLGIPTVLVNCRPTKPGTLPSVTPDDYAGSRRLAEFVLAQGHERLTYVRLNPVLIGGEERLRAFRDAIAASGVRDDRVSERLGMTGPVGHEENFVYDEVTQLVQSSARPTAIFCGNDEIALKAYLAVLAAGLKVPRDVSIVGFDDFQTISLGLRPALTTAALPYYDLGYRGADRLDRLLSGQPLKTMDLRLHCPLIVRGSCAPPSPATTAA
jgi:LacI family transcriptional regulator